MERRERKLMKVSIRVQEALQELNEMLEACGHKDGKPTEIYIRVRGTHEESMVFELEDLSEALEILRLNS